MLKPIKIGINSNDLYAQIFPIGTNLLNVRGRLAGLFVMASHYATEFSESSNLVRNTLREMSQIQQSLFFS